MAHNYTKNGDQQLKKNDRSIKMLDVSLTSSSRGQVLEILAASLVSIEGKKLSIVVTPNPEQLVQAQTDDQFRYILNHSTFALPDGIGLAWARKVLSLKSLVFGQNHKPFAMRHTLERMPGIEMAEELIGICAKEGLRVMMYGGREGIAAKAAEKVLGFRFQVSEDIKHQTLHIIGLDGPKDVSQVEPEEKETFIKAITDFKPQLLLVGLGAPWQEKWVWEHREMLEKSGVRVVMVVGGAFDVWAGRIQRAPVWIGSIGMEWLWRLIQEPWRWKRQLRLLTFIRLVFKELLA